MFCSKCGATNPENVRSCAACGAPLRTQTGPPSTTAPSAAAPATLGLALPYAQPTETSGKAIASLICGICFWIFPAAVAAIILGHLSISEINRAAGRLKGRGMAITGLVLGYGGILFIPFILIIAAIAIPNLIRARMAANEVSAAASLRQIDTAAMQYHAHYRAYPPSLTALDGADSSGASCEHAQLIDQGLARGTKQGYVFEYVPTGTPVAWAGTNGESCMTAGSTTYHVTAVPLTVGTTGRRAFYMDQTGVIRYELGRIATADSPMLGGAQTL